MTARFTVEALASHHDRGSFSCGVAALDRYLREIAGQDVKRRMASCFVAIESASGRVAGFYTLASASLPVEEIPAQLASKLPRYPVVPGVRLGRLAIGLDFRGIGLGGALLADAMARAMGSEIAAYAMIVNARDAAARSFYRHHGFIEFASAPLSLFLPLGKAVKG